jgi:uncharacterized membrane protein
MSQIGASNAGGLTTQRIEALSDGVFAIAMTLLVLELHVPRIAAERVAEDLAPALRALAPNLVAFVVSFVLLGTLWVGQHFQFHWVRRTNRPLIWINLFFLMCISFLPFSAALLSEYGANRHAVLVYGVNLLLAGLLLALSWRYAMHHGFVAQALSPAICRSIELRIWGGFAAYALSAILAFVDPRISLVGFVLVPVAYILPGRVDRHFSKADS